MTESDAAARVEQFRAAFRDLATEMGKRVVGQREIVEGVLVAFFAGGHVLLEGVPGLGKTMLVRTLAEAVGLRFSRVQFTPDLMPADITGTTLLADAAGGGREWRFQPGPVFTNLLLADEINRATPKTQSALLEAMQERAVTVGGTRHALEEPFVVLATQNPLEMEGTYPLPEAQLDRFFFKLLVRFPSAEELHEILDRTTAGSLAPLAPILPGPEALRDFRAVVREVPVAREVQERAVGLVLATHPMHPAATPLARRFVRYGASPRGAQALVLAAKIYALLEGRYHVARVDIDRAAPAALRHRVLMNYEGEAEGHTADAVIAEALGEVRLPA